MMLMAEDDSADFFSGEDKDNVWMDWDELNGILSEDSNPQTDEDNVWMDWDELNVIHSEDSNPCQNQPIRGRRSSERQKVCKITAVDETEVSIKALLEKDKKRNNDLQDLHLEQKKSHNEQEQLIEELLAQEKTSNNEMQKLQSEPKKSDNMQQELIEELLVRDKMSNNKLHKLKSELKKSRDDLQELRSQLITGLNEMPGFDTIGVKKLGEVEAKPFQEFCKQKFSVGEVNEMSAKLCSFFQEYLKRGQTTNEDYDEIVVWIKGSFSDDIHDAVKKALMEMNEYNPIEQKIVPELWNFAENRKATLKEVVTVILNKLKVNG